MIVTNECHVQVVSYVPGVQPYIIVQLLYNNYWSTVGKYSERREGKVFLFIYDNDKTFPIGFVNVISLWVSLIILRLRQAHSCGSKSIIMTSKQRCIAYLPLILCARRHTNALFMLSYEDSNSISLEPQWRRASMKPLATSLC